MAAFRGFQAVARFRASHIFGQTLQTCFYRAATVARAQQLNLFRQAHAREYARQAFNYQRYKASSNLFKRWAARPSFYYEFGGLGAAGGGFYFYNLEAVPVSGRKRFNVVSPQLEQQTAGQMYQETLQQFGQKILPGYTKEHQMVQRVLNRLVPHSGLEADDWEIHVIDDPMKNAFVIPGGKVFVFRGILDICRGDDGLAAVLGHEIAHNVAHHAAERMSQSGILLVVGLALYTITGVDFGLVNGLTQLAFTLPGSRKQEQEADYIGLLMMAESCYNPEAAIGLWSRMEQTSQGEPPQFMSTHPSNHNRLEKIRSWMPAAEAKYHDSDCQITTAYANDFNRITAPYKG